MAIEDEVVSSTLKVATTLVVGGVKLAVEIVGAGAMLAGLTYKAISKKISQKKANKETLTGGEVTFEKIMQSGEDIHAVWLNEADVENFTMLAKRMGIPFFAVKNGDELEKSKGIFRKNKEDNQFVFFSDEYSNMVSISYRASDEVRMAHILEMFPTFNPAQVTHTQTPEQALTEGQEEESTPLDDVERFMEENGVEVERPPEVVAYEEVNNQNERASETNLPVLNDENSREHMEVGDDALLCFSTFGFTETPTQEQFDEAYNSFMEKNGLNPNEPNVFSALHEQGSKIISGEVTPSKPEFVTIKSADERWQTAYNKFYESNKHLDVFSFRKAEEAFHKEFILNGTTQDKVRILLDLFDVGGDNGFLRYHNETLLWGQSVSEHTGVMREIYESIPEVERPKGMTLNDIDILASKMEAALGQSHNTPTQSNNGVKSESNINKVPEGFRVLGFEQIPTSTQQLKEAYNAFIEKNAGTLKNPEAIATSALENCLQHLEKAGEHFQFVEVPDPAWRDGYDSMSDSDKAKFLAVNDILAGATDASAAKVDSTKGKSELPECFKTLGFDKMPTSVQEVKDKYFQFVENSGSMKHPEKVANEAFAACLKHLEKGESVRTKLEAKRERNSLSGAVGEAVERAAEQAANKVAKKSTPQLVQ